MSETFVSAIINYPRADAEGQAATKIARDLDIESLDATTARTLFVMIAAKVVQDSGDAFDLVDGASSVAGDYQRYQSESRGA